MRLDEETKANVERQLSERRLVQQHRAAIDEFKEKIRQKEQDRDSIYSEILANDREKKRLEGQNRLLRQRILQKENSILSTHKHIARRQAKIDEVRERILGIEGDKQLKKEQQQYREECRKQRAEMFRSEY
tara:strand:- start:46 stop:438 length:393 start_codon:yes stop_codon:yes gene_type:complete